MSERATAAVLRATSRLDAAVARMAGRVADAIEPLADDDVTTFLRALAATVGPSDAGDGSCLDLPTTAREPIDQLVAHLGPSAPELDLLALAAAPHHDEGIAAVLRRLHPARLPWPTIGLASLVLADCGLVRETLALGTFARAGVLVVGDGSGDPYPERSLRVAPLLWETLAEVAFDTWPEGCLLDHRPTPAWGLDGWLDEVPSRAACAAIAGWEPVAVVVATDRPGPIAARVAALVETAGRTPVVLHAAALDDRLARHALTLAIARDLVPVFWTEHPLGGALPVDGIRAPLVVVAPPGRADVWPRTALRLRTDALPRDARAAALSAALSGTVPVAHPVGPATLEPSDLAIATADVIATAALSGTRPALADLAIAVDDRSADSVPAGALLVHPTATWDDLVLPVDRATQLREAVERVEEQTTVFEEWGFLRGRAGRRGLRLLFTGPPGTGKTLAAEVVANALGCDLLIVDLSRMVSKWIGETEKNLAATFDAAEVGGAVLFFDEADALFARRTEVSDARDRYANLETAYLLSRLERFDGVAVLATNLRHSLDSAFSRRIEFIVAFDQPDVTERELLWRRHLPDTAPVAPSVDIPRLAALYDVPGALIRNAAVSAAFLAASEHHDPAVITMRHVVHALQREYQKAGLAFPGAPVGASRTEPRRTPS